MGALPWTSAAPKFLSLCLGKQLSQNLANSDQQQLMSPRLTPVKHFEGEKHCVIPQYSIIYKMTSF